MLVVHKTGELPMKPLRGSAERHRRIDVRRHATVINSDGAEIDAEILDVSAQGFRIKLDDQLRVGELVVLRVDHEMLEAEIRWALGGEAGGRFVSPIDPSIAGGIRQE